MLSIATSKESRFPLSRNLYNAGLLCLLFGNGFQFQLIGYTFYYYYLLLVPLTIWGLVKHPRLPVNLAIFFSIFAIYAFAQSSINGNGASALFQYSGILLITLFSYFVLVENRFDMLNIFNIYFNFSFLVSCILLLQVVGYISGIEALYNYEAIIPYWRIHIDPQGLPHFGSVLPEASHFVMAIGPAIYLSVRKIVTGKPELATKSAALTILLSTLLSFSALGYMAILLSMLLVFASAKPAKSVIWGTLFTLLALLSYQSIEAIQNRVSDTISLISGQSDINRVEQNISVSVYFNHVYVAYMNMRENWLFGGGLGSHEIAYDKHSIIQAEHIYGWNRKDANSVFLRTMSELGLPGLFFLFLFLFQNFPYRGTRGELFANAALLMIVIYGTRQGHYFLLGFQFWCLVYYFSSKTPLHSNR